MRDLCLAVQRHQMDLFLPLLQRAAMKLGLGKIDVLQGRSFLQFPLKNIDISVVDSPHVDIDN